LDQNSEEIVEDGVGEFVELCEPMTFAYPKNCIPSFTTEHDSLLGGSGQFDSGLKGA
jgi:hypothetical protein